MHLLQAEPGRGGRREAFKIFIFAHRIHRPRTIQLGREGQLPLATELIWHKRPYRH